jgi:glycine/D-amino acid oxidase-like deaminating enzyme
MLPTSTKYLIIGAGMHGLSTSYHLAIELKIEVLAAEKISW